MVMKTEEGRPARRGSGRFKVLIIIVVLVVAGWTGLWFAAASLFERELDKVLAQMAAGGTTVTCVDRSIEGFPFRLELRCLEGLTFANGGAEASVGKVTAVALLYAPTEVIIEARSPARLERPAVVEAEWTLAHASVGFGLSERALNQLRAEVEEIALTGPGLPASLTSDLLGLYLRPAPDDASSAEIAVRATTLVPYPEAPAVDVIGRVIVPDGGALLAGNPAPLLSRLTGAGIPVRIEEIRATSDKTAVSLGGDLTLRPDGLLDGSLNLAIAAPDGTLPYLDRVSPDLSQAVSGLLVNVLPFAPATKIGDMDARSIALSISSGRVSAGLIPIGRIPRIVLAGS